MKNKILKNILVTAIALSLGITANVEGAQPKSKCKVSDIDANFSYVTIETNVPKKGYKNLVEVSDYFTGKVAKSTYTKPPFHCVWLKKLKKNKLYVCRSRQISQGDKNIKGKWSKKKVFGYFVWKSAFISNGFYFVAPKVKGVKHFQIYISTEMKGTYKKLGTIKPGKDKRIINKKSVNGKSLWFKFKPILKKKQKCYSTFDFHYYDTMMGFGYY